MSAALLPLALVLAGAVGSTGLPHASVSVNDHVFSVQIAASETARQHGLMGRDHLTANAGMWFVFDQAKPRFFWMKNTPIALDMLFFDADRRLVSMQVNVPPCKADPCPLYPSGKPAKYVLEVPAGTAWRLELHPGAVASVKGPAHAAR